MAVAKKDISVCAYVNSSQLAYGTDNTYLAAARAVADAYSLMISRKSIGMSLLSRLEDGIYEHGERQLQITATVSRRRLSHISVRYTGIAGGNLLTLDADINENGEPLQGYYYRRSTTTANWEASLRADKPYADLEGSEKVHSRGNLDLKDYMGDIDKTLALKGTARRVHREELDVKQ